MHRTARTRSWFLPFNKGWNDGAGNPPNPDGLKTDYLWKEVLTPAGLTNILENRCADRSSGKSGTRRRKDPRGKCATAGVPALSSARRGAEDIGARSGERCGRAVSHPAFGRQRQVQLHRVAGAPTHRREARRQGGVRLGDRGHRPAHFWTTRSYTDSEAVHAGRRDSGLREGPRRIHSGELRKFIAEGKKIIISTIQTFPFVPR